MPPVDIPPLDWLWDWKLPVCSRPGWLFRMLEISDEIVDEFLRP